MNNNVRISDIPENERPIEKMLINGPEGLNNAELLAIILRTGVRGENVVSLSSRLLSEVEGLDGLLNSNYYDMTNIKGIKKIKASQLIAMIELFNRFKTLRSQSINFKISSPKNIASMLMNEMTDLNQEVLKLIMLNTKNEVVGIKDVFKGSLNSSIVHPREIFREAIKRNSASIIICHNHPSGDPTPSKEDINITIRLKECASIMGIELLDHIIIGNSKFVSLKEKGIL
ncbi:MAG: RadC family protein [Clostridium sp.]